MQDVCIIHLPYVVGWFVRLFACLYLFKWKAIPSNCMINCCDFSSFFFITMFRPSPAKVGVIWKPRFKVAKCKPKKVCWSCWLLETALSSMTANLVSKRWAKVHFSSVNTTSHIIIFIYIYIHTISWMQSRFSRLIRCLKQMKNKMM